MPAKAANLYSSDMAAKLTAMSANLRNLGHSLVGLAYDHFGDRETEFKDLKALAMTAERYAEEVLLIRSMLCKPCQMIDVNEDMQITRSSR